MLAADYAAHAIFAPGTPTEVVEQWEMQQRVTDMLQDAILAGSRWNTSAIDSSPSQGDPIRVTWSIVPDGTILNTNGGGGDLGVGNGSDLVAFLDGIYGDGGTTNYEQKPWFSIFSNIYDVWSENTGLELVYEPFDDGGVMGDNANVGVAGVRGDMRVGGRLIDGNSNVLAYNYYPNGGGLSGLDGDMVIDTADNFYVNFSDGPGGENRGLTNVLAHEVGHGIGIAHVLPVDSTKLMEPFVNFAFLGPQEDDIFNAQQLYGDNLESNDTLATATNLGLVKNATRTLSGASIDNGDTDVDVYAFDINAPTELSVLLRPTGSQYDVAGQAFGSVPSGPYVTVNRMRQADLRFRLLSEDGTELLAVDNGALGAAETLNRFALESAGRYYLQVEGSGNEPQLYDVTLQVGTVLNLGQSDTDLKLVSVNPNADAIFSNTSSNLLNVSPTELTFRFSGGTDLDESTLDGGIRIRHAGNDQQLGTPDDVFIEPGWVGFGETDRVVITRFAQPLEDGRYRVEVFGVDLPEEGIEAIRDIDNEALVPRISGTDRDIVDFELELGARVLSVVPQPVLRDAAGQLDPQWDRIDVYFNDNDLFAGGGTTTLSDPDFYQLIRTENTVTSADDTVVTPIDVNVVEFETQNVPNPLGPGTIGVQVRVNRVELTFANELNDIAGSGAFRLKIGSDDPVAMPLTTVAVGSEATSPNNTIAGSQLLATLNGSTAIKLSSEIVSGGLPFDLPGANNEPGHRDIEEETHLNVGADTTPGIQTLYYNFALDRPYGTNDNNQSFTTVANAEQLQRFREVFDIYGQMFGVDFVETVDRGITVVVGDMSPNGRTSGPGGVAGVANASLAILDSAETWDNSFGGGFFRVAMHELGHSLGLGHTYDQPGGTIMGNANEYAGSSTEWVFPGDVDLVHGRYIYRPDNLDVDMYRLDLPAGQAGELSLETFAERRAGGSLLNSQLVVYKQVGSGPVERVASNDDAYGDDAALTLQLEASSVDTKYFVAVTARGNDDFDPNIENSGSGGDSQGVYDLLVRFKSNTGATITDAAGTPLDGDGDGTPGGAFDFWFNTTDKARTLFVDASAAATGANDGSLASPFREIDRALAAAGPGDIVRIVANANTDGVVGLPNDNFAGADDNLAYVIGKGLNNATLKDGRDLIVPKDVTVMIDAGVVLKMLGSRIAVGSGDNGVDASGGALQVLGVPHLPVFITSYNDPGPGVEQNGITTTPRQGDWGGIDFRNGVDRAQGRLDLEREGIFLNTVMGAQIEYGGGDVDIDGVQRAITPIRMDAARPTLVNNQINNSASAALSADPPSFEETNFTTERYQRNGAFVPDYDRVGPVIYGNTVIDNTINGLLVRIDSLAGNKPEQLSVPGRFDDTEITHVLDANLLITGNPVGRVLQEQPAAPTTVGFSVVPPTGGATAAVPVGTYDYILTFVDAFGVESLPTAPTGSVTVSGPNDGIQLTGLPDAGTQRFPVQALPVNAEFAYVSRRLYRRVGAGNYELVAELNRSDSSYVDNRTTPLAGVNPPVALDASGNIIGTPERYRSRPDGRLVIDAGVVLKSSGARIEAGFGADLIAEGEEGRPVVMTSRTDDRYGAGGTFDTDNFGDSTGAPGNWAGIYTSPFSRLSLDQAVVAFAGGTSIAGGSSYGFNAVEIHQGTARISNTVFEANASGTAGSGGTRAGRGPNDSSVIFVAGSQPVIVDNTFIDVQPLTAIVSINANALNAVPLNDFGRQTGFADLADHPPGNYGPLVSGNRINAGGLSGMRVRGETLTTESVWDDTDMVHIVSSDIEVPDVHTYGGLRLQSRADESLVVKLNNGAQLIAGGRPLDIEDRIGGIVQIVGSPGFPVVLTALSDDSVGAGFDALGMPLVDTDGNGASVGTPGEWGGIEFREYTHDRNVEVITERESAIGSFGDLNASTATAQPLGQLATSEKASNEDLRLGYSIYGTIASPGDIDMYSFRATAGTTVWIDVDRTASTLDAVIEVVDGAGVVLARSDNSHTETLAGAIDYAAPGVLALPMQQDPFAVTNQGIGSGTYRDFYTTNPRDAAMRLVLPGTVGSGREYFVRIVGAGESSGLYQMQLRLQEKDEFAGSTVRYADIRYADVGIKTLGLPSHSFLTGEAAVGSNGTVDVGNIANSDRAAITVSGNLTASNRTNTVTFSVQRDAIQVISGAPGVEAYIATTIDVDFADETGRPDTMVLLYYRGASGTQTPQLVMIGDDSNIASDRSGPGEGSDLDDLTRGSVGERDPFIGTVELRAGVYDLVVTTKAVVPIDLRQYFQATGANNHVRLEPLTSVVRIVEDRFNSAPQSTASGPISVAFDLDKSAGEAQNNVTPYGLGDVTLFMIGGNTSNGDRIDGVNPQLGTREVTGATVGRQIGTAAMHPDGYLFGFVGDNGTENDANTATFYRLGDDFSATLTTVGGSGLTTFETYIDTAPDPDVRVVGRPVGDNGRNGDGMLFTAMSYRVTTNVSSNDTLRLYGVSSRGNNTLTFPQPISYDIDGNPVNEREAPAMNYIYRLNTETGEAISANVLGDRVGARRAAGAGTPQVELGRIAPDILDEDGNVVLASPTVGSATFAADYAAYQAVFGTVTGLTAVGSTLYAFTNTGAMVRINASDVGDNAGNRNGDRKVGTFLKFVTDEAGDPITFGAATTGPRNLSDAFDVNGNRTNHDFSSTIFASSSSGRVFTLNTAGDLLDQVGFGETSISTGTSGVSGIAFSTLDVNLWHIGGGAPDSFGHGTPATQDGLRDLSSGGSSLNFTGNTGVSQGSWTGQWIPDRSLGNYDFPGGAHGSVQSNPIDLRGYSSEDLPYLYFNYFLETEDSNSPGTSISDALRVYVSSERDPSWTLVSTNNEGGNRDYTDGTNDLDISVSKFVDEDGNYQFVQELYDTDPAVADQWRQARVSLAPWAGDNDVRIRYEFATSGDIAPSSLELRVVSPDRMLTGGSPTNAANRSFSLRKTFGGTRYDFEFDYGLVIDVPTGVGMTNGATLSLTRNVDVLGNTDNETVTFTFQDLDINPSLPANGIGYRVTDTAAQIANQINTVLTAANFDVQFSAGIASRIGIAAELTGANGMTATGAGGLPAQLLSTFAANEQLRVVDGAALTVGNSFTINTVATSGGASANAATTFTFVNAAAGPGSIVFDADMTATEVARAIVDAMRLVGYDVNIVDGTAYTATPRIQVRAPSTITATHTLVGLPTSIVRDTAGVTAGATAIPVTVDMTTMEMRNELQIAMAAAINPNNPHQLLPYQLFGESVKVFGLELLNADNVNAVVGFGGEQSGVETPGGGSEAARGRNNAFAGVFIDDIIIGFAERGELVHNANPGNTLVDNIFYEPQVLLGGARPEEIDFGEFQVEIRASAEYGTADWPANAFDRDWDTNDVVGQGVALPMEYSSGFVNGPLDGAALSDGDTLQISDGVKILTFEFNALDATGAAALVQPGNIAVPFTSTSTTAQVATALRDAINTSSVQQNFGVSASSPGGETAVGVGDSDTVLLHGLATSDLLGGLSFRINRLDGSTLFLNTQVFGAVDLPGNDSGDSNRWRDQGQVLLQGNRISYSGSFGIYADAGRRSTPIAPLSGDQSSRPGAPQSFVTVNPDNLAPGVIVTNNVLYGNVGGGIRISGDASINPLSPQPFAKVINNTIYGALNGDVGIQVDERAAPTLLNNAVTHSSVGIRVSNSPALEHFNTLYWQNGVNTQGTGLGADFLVIGATEAVFNDPAAGNLYPAPGSGLIDSSAAKVDERQLLKAIKAELGIPEFEILAPQLDITGQLRGYDNTGNPNNTGVKFDRGALDSSDLVGPVARLQEPLDNDAEGRDIDRSVTYVQWVEGSVSQFVIQLDENFGTGPDAATVTTESIIITENGQRLIPGADYTFGYVAASRTILLTPKSGVWRPDAAYEITLNNRDRVAMQAETGVQTVDEQLLTIVDENNSTVVFEFDSGYVLELQQSPVLSVVGAVSDFKDTDSFTLVSPDGLTSETFEFEILGGVFGGKIPVDISAATSLEDIRDAIFLALDDPTVKANLGLAPIRVGTTQIQLGAQAGSSISESLTGLEVLGNAGGVVDQDRFSYTSNGTTLVFEFKAVGSSLPAQADTDVVILFDPLDTAEQLAQRLVNAVLAQPSLGLDTARVLDGGRVYLGGQDSDVLLNLQGTALDIQGTPGVSGGLTLTVPDTARGSTVNGQRFSITVDGVSRDFQLSTDATLVTTDQLVVVLPTDAANAIATAIATAIRSQFGGLNSSATANVVTLGETRATAGVVPSVVIDLLTSNLTLSGVAGGSVAIPFIPIPEFTADTMAGQIMSAIGRSSLVSGTFAPGGGTILLDRTISVDGLPNAFIGAIRDRAGNLLQANRPNLETQFTILMPQVGLDYGDAEARFPTLSIDNGARHTVASDRLPRLGREVDSEADGQPTGNDDVVDTFTVSYADSDATNGALVSLSTVAASRVQVSVSSSPDVVDAGDVLTIQVDGKFTVDLELVLAGNSPIGVGSLPLLIIPGEASESFAERLSAAVSDALSSAAELAGVPLYTDVRVDQALPGEFTILSVDDEDGVRVSGAADPVDGLFLDSMGNILGFLNPLDPRGTDISVTVTGSGLLDAWIDFNQDGDWTDPGEQILQNVAVLDGENLLHVTAPSTALNGLTWARFRLSTTGNLDPEGVAIGGEVEDYQVRVTRFALPTPIDDGDSDPAFTVDEDNTLTVGAADSILSNDSLSPDLTDERVELVDDVQSGTLTLNADGTFTYVPNAEFNGIDTFTYRIVGDQTVVTGTLPNPTFEARSMVTATVTITVNAVNDAPTFDISDPVVEVLERDDETQPVNVPWASNVLPGPADATDEDVQDVSFTLVPHVGNTPNLFVGAVTISDTGQLQFTPVADAVGTAVFTVTAMDTGSGVFPNVNTSAPVNLTIQIRPVNDPPRIDSAVLGTGEASPTEPTDDAYTVDALGRITYTLREDNTQAGGGVQPYVINLTDTSGAAYGPIGLLDVFNAGPTSGSGNEESLLISGGGQTIRLSSFDVVDTLPTTQGGSVTVQRDSGSGAITHLLYTPPADSNNTFRGPDSFVYTVADNGQSWTPGVGLEDDFQTANNTIFFNLTAVNDAPVFTPVRTTVTSLEDQPEVRTTYASSVFAGPAQTAFDETDIVTGQRVNFTITPSGAANQALASQLFAVQPVINRDGTLSYTAAANQFGSVVFDVVLTDNGSNDPSRGDLVQSATQQLTITVQPQNDAPVFANTDPVAFTLDEDNSFLIPYRALPGDPQGLLDKFNVGPANEQTAPLPGGQQTLSLGTPVPASTPAGGQLTQVTIDGRQYLRYTPKPDFNGSDSFTYSVVDNGQSVNLAGVASSAPKTAFFSVNLTVNPVNDRPQFGGAGNVSAVEDAGQNDASVPAADVGLTVIPQWATNIQPGPAGASDELASQDVTFTITPVNDALARTVFAVDGSGNLQVSADPDGTLRFRTLPDANTSLSGAIVFNVSATDDDPTSPSTSLVKTFTITIQPVNDPPSFTTVAGADVVSHPEDSGSYDQPWVVETSIVAGPADEITAGQTVRFDVTVDAVGATLFQSGPVIEDDGRLRFTPAANANGTATVTVVAVDSGNASSTPVTFQIVLTPEDDAPVANPDQFTVNEDDPRTLLASELLINDVDPDLPDDELTIVLPKGVTQSGATITVDAQNNVTFLPSTSPVLQRLAPGQTATDTFTYLLEDSTGLRSEAVTVSLTVTGINDAPQLLPDNPDVQSTGSTILRPLDNDVDVDGTLDLSTLQITLSPAFGAVTLPGDGTIVYTPYAGFNGTDTLRYTIKDNLGAQGAGALINIVANNAPIVVADRATTFQNEAVDIAVLANDSDPDLNGSLDAQSLVVVTPPSSGTAFPLQDSQGNLTGEIRYVPATGFSGSDSFTYRVSDNLGRASGVATVNITVSASRLQNPLLNLDVDGDGDISPIDALLNVNLLNRVGQLTISDQGTWAADQSYPQGALVRYNGSSWLAETTPAVGETPVAGSRWSLAAKPFYDVDGNLRIEPFDVLTVVNELNRRARLGRNGLSGESVPAFTRSSSVTDERASDTPPSTLDTPPAKVVSTDFSIADVVVDDEDLLDTLARDKPASEAAEQEVIVDTLWRDFE